MDTRDQSVPCEDVPEWELKLTRRGFKFLGSEPDQNLPGFCTVHFQDPAPAAEPAMALAASPTAAPSPFHSLQKRTAQAIVNIFETGEVLGKYGQVTLIAGDSGHLTFGRSQTTLATGNLGRLLTTYCNTSDARFADRLKDKYLPRLRDRDPALDKDLQLHNLLRATADDPVMRVVQDEFFDKNYWELARARAAEAQIETPLGIAVVYDSVVHGSWGALRDKTNDALGNSQVNEQTWIQKYLDVRADWLANHTMPALHPTVYRMRELKAIADHGNWSLELPLVVSGREISLITLLAEPPDCYDGPAPGSRSLGVTTPIARGLDVRLVQLGLSDAGMQITADGVFGAMSAAALKQYQKAKGINETGVANPGLIAQIVD